MRATFLVGALILAASCQAPAVTEAAPAGGPVAQDAANTQYQPAFAGQTRAPEQRSSVALDVRTVAEGLDHPWAIEFLPGGRMLVTERPGRLRVVSATGQISAPIAGLPQVSAESQGGLLDVALSPNFATDRLIYWSYAEPRGRNTTATAAARGRLSDDATRVENVQVFFRQEPAWESELHYGSRIVFDTSGHVYITLGERSNPESRVHAQDLTTLLGKTVRLNADGSIPSDNPFVGRSDARPEIWSYGQRNIQGAALHPETGRLWTIEHGPRGGDELNVPQAGKNYGWPVITYGIEYSGATIGEGITQREGMEQPIYYWDPVIAPGGMTFYTGQLFPDWRGDLFIGALRGALVRLELDGERVIAEEHLVTDVGRIRDVTQGPDGALYVVTDEDEGRILRIAPRG